jgi:serine/threonine-protein kinase
MTSLEPTLIGPVPPSTARSRSGARRRHGPPADLLREASSRLSIVAFLAGLLWSIAAVLNHVIEKPLTHAGHEHGSAQILIPDVIALVVISASFALSVYARYSRRDPRTILDLGLGYMICLAFAMGQSFHWGRLPPGGAEPMISWIGVIVLLFATLVPATPGKTLVAGLFAVSMNPVGMLIAKARGNWDFGPNINVLVMHYPDYLLAGVAVVISHLITRLGEQVSRAREMGSYRLGELLGSGGMGEVYRASHRLLARPAAIKLIRGELLGDRSPEQQALTVTRFRREAEVAASLQSPHTVALYDFGVTEDQTLYLVMELLDGLDLEAMIRTHGALPPNRVVYLIRQVCASLREAHARGLVHRDIKPANIHVGRYSLEYDFVKVLDFGLVTTASSAVGSRSLQSAAQQHIPGTPAYMAPEMALSQPVDARADIYALGCVAYFALTGKLVFESSSLVQLLAKHAYEAPAPPSQQIDQLLPIELDQIVLDCLAKDPADRISSAGALDTALAALELEPWTQEHARAWWSVHAPPVRPSGAA